MPRSPSRDVPPVPEVASAIARAAQGRASQRLQTAGTPGVRGHMGPVQLQSAPEEETKAAPARPRRLRLRVPERCFSSPPAPNLASPARSRARRSRILNSALVVFWVSFSPAHLTFWCSFPPAPHRRCIPLLVPARSGFWVSSPPAPDSPPEFPHVKRRVWNLRWE